MPTWWFLPTIKELLKGNVVRLNKNTCNMFEPNHKNKNHEKVYPINANICIYDFYHFYWGATCIAVN